MKQNKRRTATVVYIFIFMLTVSGCVRKGKEQDKVYQETGMFEWSECIVQNIINYFLRPFAVMTDHHIFFAVHI